MLRILNNDWEEEEKKQLKHSFFALKSKMIKFRWMEAIVYLLWFYAQLQIAIANTILKPDKEKNSMNGMSNAGVEFFLCCGYLLVLKGHHFSELFFNSKTKKNSRKKS